MSLNGADTYETWVYTIQDLQNEINLKANQPQNGPGPGLNQTK